MDGTRSWMPPHVRMDWQSDGLVDTHVGEAYEELNFQSVDGLDIAR